LHSKVDSLDNLRDIGIAWNEVERELG
jgi:hypothetical protein